MQKICTFLSISLPLELYHILNFRKSIKAEYIPKVNFKSMKSERNYEINTKLREIRASSISYQNTSLFQFYHY